MERSDTARSIPSAGQHTTGRKTGRVGITLSTHGKHRQTNCKSIPYRFLDGFLHVRYSTRRTKAPATRKSRATLRAFILSGGGEMQESKEREELARTHGFASFSDLRGVSTL